MINIREILITSPIIHFFIALAFCAPNLKHSHTGLPSAQTKDCFLSPWKLVKLIACGFIEAIHLVPCAFQESQKTAPVIDSLKCEKRLIFPRGATLRPLMQPCDVAYSERTAIIYNWWHNTSLSWAVYIMNNVGGNNSAKCRLAEGLPLPVPCARKLLVLTIYAPAPLWG